MKKEDKQQIRLHFPLGFYLKQLFSNNTYVRYINPFSFWRRYKINHLETCHELNIVQYLEHCYQLNYTNIYANSSLKLAVNIVIYPLPQIELKYRGVIYYTEDTISININLVEINSCLVESSSFQQASSFNDIGTSEKFGSS